MARFALCSWTVGVALCGFGAGMARAQEVGEKFRAGLSAKVQALEKNNAPALVGVGGWLFVTAELRMMAAGKFWGADAVKISRSPKPENADPLPAILDFNQQLKDRGVTLIVVPVPPKAELYPEAVAADLPPVFGDPDPALAAFYAELRRQGVDVVDLAPEYGLGKNTKPPLFYCRTDTHWNGIGCVVAAQAIAKEVSKRLPTSADAGAAFPYDWKEIAIDGDLGGMLDAGATKPGAEKISVRQLRIAVTPDPNSPVLLLGDSHALVFHDFLAERAGLLDQLAVELGTVPDRIAVRGSGATAVRIDLYRRSVREPGYLAKKKVVVWCFTAREFTEAAQGWQKVPVTKP